MEQEIKEDIYSIEITEEFVDDDVISAEEQGFMQGYLAG
jgi:hypothetical protein